MASVSVAKPFTAALVFEDEYDNPTNAPTLIGLPVWEANTDLVTITTTSDGMGVSVQANEPVVPLTVLSVTYDTGSGPQTLETDEIEWIPVSSPSKAVIKLTLPKD